MIIKLLASLFKRAKFTWNTDRLGPDIFATHWMLHFPPAMTWLCTRKFGSFAESADFRPGAYAFGTGNIHVGERVVIRPGSVLGANPRAEIIIEDDALIGGNTHIYSNNHRFENTESLISNQGYDAAEIRLGKGCWIGANVTILAGVTIGEHAVVAAGAVVSRNVEPRTLVGGVPAKLIRTIDAEKPR